MAVAAGSLPHAERAVAPMSTATPPNAQDDITPRSRTADNLVVISADRVAEQSAPSGVTRVGGRSDAPARARTTPHEEPINTGRARTTFGDGPHDEALTSSHVAGDEHARNTRHVRIIAPHVPALVELDSESIEPATLLGSHETEGQEHEIGRDLAIGAVDFHERAVLHLDFMEKQRTHSSVSIVDEAFGVDAVETISTLFVCDDTR